MKMRWLCVLIGVASVLFPTAHSYAQQAVTQSPMVLTRCVATVEAPCMSLHLTIPAALSRSVSEFDSTQESGAWSAIVAGTRLVGPGVSIQRKAQQPFTLFVLIEQSEAMGTEAATFARIAITSLFQSLDSTTARVGVTTYNTHRVRDQIADVAFGTPSSAMAQLDQLTPFAKGDRGALLTAIYAGVDRMRALSVGQSGAVLVITTGSNDVARRGDDAGLLSGADGVQSVTSQVAAAAFPVWIVQLESPSARTVDSAQLAGIAGARGRYVIAKRDPNAITRVLHSLVRERNSDRTLVFGAPVLSATSLARTAWRGIVSLSVNDRQSLSIPLQWRPPLFTLPPYAGAADSAAVPAELREALSAGTELASTRWLIGFVLFLVGLALWIFVPRLMWSGQSETAQDIARRTAYYRGKASTQELLLLRGPAPREGAPRKPSDPTVQTELLKRPGR